MTIATICGGCGTTLPAWAQGVCPRCALLEQAALRYGDRRSRRPAARALRDCLSGSWSQGQTTISFDFDAQRYTRQTPQGTRAYQLALVEQHKNRLVFTADSQRVQVSVTSQGALVLEHGGTRRVFRDSAGARLCPHCLFRTLHEHDRCGDCGYVWGSSVTQP
jgi:predicted amidophosphoribosyltransferase